MSLALRQTKALFVDAYRELNARKLFWVTLGLSLLVVAVCACIGVKGSSVTFLGWTVNDNLRGPLTQPAKFYKAMFVTFGIGFWLTWAAMILALISSASLFPDFLSGGAIELVLSKPMGRLRLFLTKYATGLLFTAIQVGVFTLGCFMLLGVRGGSWEPRMFLAVPIVVGMYSFLFCMCVLLGILTRSTIASLLLTLLLWFLIFLVNAADATVASFSIMNEVAMEKLPARITQMEKTARGMHESRVKGERQKAIEAAEEAKQDTSALPKVEDPIPEPTQADLDALNPKLAKARKSLASNEENAPMIRTLQRVATGVKFALPKTTETPDLLNRFLLEPGDLQHEERGDPMADAVMGLLAGDMREVGKRMEARERGKTLTWILGTSIGFEVVILSIAGWLFVRKEF